MVGPAFTRVMQTNNYSIMKSFKSFLFTLLLSLVMPMSALAQADAERDVYLFSGFREPALDGLHLLYSYDGLHWDSLAGTWLTPKIGNKKPYIDAYTGEEKEPRFMGQSMMRDPSIVQGPDGTFHCVWTLGWQGDLGFGYASSKDLIHWSEQRRIPVMDGAKVNNVWAPEVFYDDEKKEFYIIWSSSIDPKKYTAADTLGTNSCHRGYYTRTKDFRTFTKAKPHYDPGFNSIDGFLVKRGPKDYVYVVKDNRKPGYSNLFCAFGKSPKGPFGNPSQTFAPTYSEGACVVKLADEWVIYCDEYALDRYGAFSTKDFRTFTDIADRVSVPHGHKHGTIFKVKESILNGLLKEEAARNFALGADISGTTHMESRGTRFYNSKGEIRENTALMKELGLNAVRLRVWVNPRGGWSGSQDVLAMAKRAKYYGMQLMIDFHYSDWWADPGKQNIPAAWKDYDYPQMKEALAKHTRDVLQLLKDNRIDVKWVQVGNETRRGFLWPMGKTDKNMEQYAGLTYAGYEAVKSVYPNAQVIVHLDRGCDQKVYDYIFDGLKKYGARWDIIGLSVYPYWDMRAKLTKSWQETVSGFTANINHLVKKYGTPTMVVETGVEAKKAVEQKPIMDAIIHAARYECNGDCYGVFYWAPELEGHYALGAFENNRPTVIMDSFTEASKK